MLTFGYLPVVCGQGTINDTRLYTLSSRPPPLCLASKMELVLVKALVQLMSQIHPSMIIIIKGASPDHRFMEHGMGKKSSLVSVINCVFPSKAVVRNNV